MAELQNNLVEKMSFSEFTEAADLLSQNLADEAGCLRKDTYLWNLRLVPFLFESITRSLPQIESERSVISASSISLNLSKSYAGYFTENSHKRDEKSQSSFDSSYFDVTPLFESSRADADRLLTSCANLLTTLAGKNSS